MYLRILCLSGLAVFFLLCTLVGISALIEEKSIEYLLASIVYGVIAVALSIVIRMIFVKYVLKRKGGNEANQETKEGLVDKNNFGGAVKEGLDKVKDFGNKLKMKLPEVAKQVKSKESYKKLSKKTVKMVY